MKTYKALDNSLHCVDPEFASLLPAGCVEITEAQAVAIRAAQNTETPAQIRASRNVRIAACDWTQLPDAPLTSVQKTAWREYRQALRDVPEQTGFPESISWPVAP